MSNATRQALEIAGAKHERRLFPVACRVEPMVTHPARPVRAVLVLKQGPTLVQSPGVPWSGLVSSMSLPCLLPADALPDGAFPPVGPLGLTSPPSAVRCDATTATVPLSGCFACRALPDTLRAPLVRGVPAGLVAWSKRPDSARACGHPVPQSGPSVKETDGSPTFPSSPWGDMPRSQTPVVSGVLAIPHPGLRPSSACQPSAHHDSTHVGAPSRGLPSRDTRLRTAPYGEARGFAPDRLAQLSSGGT
jgi:hypothetical protein